MSAELILLRANESLMDEMNRLLPATGVPSRFWGKPAMSTLAQSSFPICIAVPHPKEWPIIPYAVGCILFHCSLLLCRLSRIAALMVERSNPSIRSYDAANDSGYSAAIQMYPSEHSSSARCDKSKRLPKYPWAKKITGASEMTLVDDDSPGINWMVLPCMDDVGCNEYFLDTNSGIKFHPASSWPMRRTDIRCW